MWNMTPLMDKLDACTRLSIKGSIRRYTEVLSIHTGAPTVHLGRQHNIIYVVGSKIVTPRVKHIEISVFF